MSEPIFFKSIYQERVWGGRNLSDALGRDLPEGKVIGESWEVVDRPEAMSVVARGEAAGMSLRELIETDTTAVMGEGYEASRPFPILIKWLDCQERLSLQVHPPAEIAPSLGGEPKTENWYIADCDEDATLIVGLKNGATEEQFEGGLKDNSLEDYVHRFPVTKGESILVESGRIHAIDAGNLILEIQQNSDTTYRVYDWGRVGLDGKPRDLHVEESLKCIDWNDFEPSAMKSEGVEVVLADCKEFRLTKYSKSGDEAALELASGEPRLLSGVGGVVEVTSGGKTTELVYGENALLPAAGSFSLKAKGDGASFIVTDRFV
ncbi:MAG: type I phosphomannose isomerase catalytic subunit [Verrucomicrobiota bacterium]